MAMMMTIRGRRFDAVARQGGRSFQELADEAFKDFLTKHKQPVG